MEKPVWRVVWSGGSEQVQKACKQRSIQVVDMWCPSIGSPNACQQGLSSRVLFRPGA